MKKGDINRGRILDCAEKLITTHGYTAMSVQMLLDALSLSKGAFYHYYVTKDAMLEAMFARRYALSLDTLEACLKEETLAPNEKLNKLMYFADLFEREDAPFTAVLLHQRFRSDDPGFYTKLRTYLSNRLSGLIAQVIDEGMRADVFFARNPFETAAIVTGLAFDAFDRAAAAVMNDPQDAECILKVMEIMDTARDAVETLLNAPFGTVVLCDSMRLTTGIRLALDELNGKEEAQG